MPGPTSSRPLPDVLASRLRVVFVGINPSIASGLAGHHFASPGNPFWRLLHAAGFTPVAFQPSDDVRLAELGLGLTNLCPRPTRSAAELARSEYELGVRELLRKLDAFRPSVVALVGVTLARIILPGSREAGPGPRAAPLAGARVFVLPNPSGRNAAYPSFESKLEWFVRLHAVVAATRTTSPGVRPVGAGRRG